METERQRKGVMLRLKRIEGQVRGLQRMVEGEVPCLDVLTQVAAATAALKRAGMAIVQGYMEECLGKNRNQPDAKSLGNFKDLQKAISRYIDWA